MSFLTFSLGWLFLALYGPDNYYWPLGWLCLYIHYLVFPYRPKYLIDSDPKP